MDLMPDHVKARFPLVEIIEDPCNPNRAIVSRQVTPLPEGHSGPIIVRDDQGFWLLDGDSDAHK